MATSNISQNAQTSKPLNELKIKAKLKLKSYRKDPSSIPEWASKGVGKNSQEDAQLTLKTMLGIVSKKAGFTTWQQASHVLGGAWQPGEDAGSFWYSRRCVPLLNIWCRDLPEAEEQLSLKPKTILFPYKKQFVVAGENYATALGLQQHCSDISLEENRNLAVNAINTKWQEYALTRITDIFNN